MSLSFRTKSAMGARMKRQGKGSSILFILISYWIQDENLSLYMCNLLNFMG